MKTAVLTVVYPAVERFFADFCASVGIQTDREFELLIFCDGWRPTLPMLDCLNGIRTRLIDVTGTPSAIRKQALAAAMDLGFSKLVLADSDDVHSATRVVAAKQRLERHTVVVNELVLFGEGILSEFAAFGDRLLSEQLITAADIRDKNCIGMSNSALRASDRLREALDSVPEGNRVFDWCFFANLLALGETAIYTRAAHTRYRQHGHNLAYLNRFGDAQIELAIEIKIEQYKSLAHHSSWYREHGHTYSRLLRRWRNDAGFRDRYATMVKLSALDGSFWWEPFTAVED